MALTLTPNQEVLMDGLPVVASRRVIRVVALASLLLAGSAAAQTTGGNDLNRFVYAKNDSLADNTSTGVTPIPGMEVQFKGRNSAIVHFCASGNMFGTGTGAVQVQANLDGSQLGDEIQFFNYSEGAATTRCFDWIAENLASGNHDVMMTWRITQGAGAMLTGRFRDSVLTVQFRKTLY